MNKFYFNISYCIFMRGVEGSRSQSPKFPLRINPPLLLFIFRSTAIKIVFQNVKKLTVEDWRKFLFSDETH